MVIGGRKAAKHDRYVGVEFLAQPGYLDCAVGVGQPVQIDADGQHDPTDLPRFVAAARADPQSLVCGRPVFDASIPRHRFYFRYLTHALVWLNTLSFDIPDSMCGLRVYPLAIVLPILAAEPPGRRMDFDSEVLVRLHWRGVRMQWLPTRVRYPVDGGPISVCYATTG